MDERQRHEALYRKWGLRLSDTRAFADFCRRADHFLRVTVDWDALRNTANRASILVVGR